MMSHQPLIIVIFCINLLLKILKRADKAKQNRIARFFPIWQYCIDVQFVCISMT